MTIKALRGENVYNTLQAISVVTSLCELFSTKPDEDATPEWSYAWATITSDIPRVYSNVGHVMKSARVSFHIVCKKELWSTDTPERVLWAIVDAISNAIVSQWSTKIYSVDGLYVQSITEDTISPIFLQDSRHIVIKDYIFNYISIG